MGDTLDKVSDCLKDSWDFLKINMRELSIDFIKLYAIIFLISIPILAILAAIIFFAGITTYTSVLDLLTNIGLLLILGVVSFFLLLILVVVNSAFYAVSYKLVEARKQGKKISIISNAKELLAPVGKYTIATSLIYIVVFLPGIILFLSSFLAISKNPMLSLSAMFGAFAVFGICYILYIMIAFFIQFSLLEVIFNRLPVIASFKKSYALVRKNLLAVFVFDVAFVIIVFGLSSAGSMVIQYVIAPVFYLLGVISFVFIFMAMAVVFVLSILWSAIVAVLRTTLLYFFWKSLGEPVNGVKPNKKLV